ncbi:FAD-binding oxidoreductase [Phycicoccus sp. MAQZ13P-2]|uniref:FAD-binding and (Fe-S)-binding domain-containing protein n=1 Tax=Phycicoccus mangrovi TaxID=2840470 RepID=UPI001BFFF686|nr:FAD-binding and (Fe-S)-binding domain-containing protein [Phycicoccus mangrovi]MBT9254615.1 FAD-binding oxidoreductase [Phycicoccus mangrovi]MBT9273180.1 FAD-binding oxidoreductase [Phycicoccus mangrovi]
MTSTGLPVHWDGMTTVEDSDAGGTLPDHVRALAAELASRVSGEVRFDEGTRAAYATDASNYRQLPVGVVLPQTVEDVVETVRCCRQAKIPLTSRGGGTSLAGQTCNVGVVIDFSKYLTGIESIDPEERTAWVQPGCTLDWLRDAAAAHGLTYGPDPATHNRNTLGGMIGNNSCGTHSVMAEFYGPGPLTVDQVLELDVLTVDGARFTVGRTSREELDAAIADGGERGRILAGLRDVRDRHLGAIRTGFPQIPRRVSGYNLPQLLDENGFDVAKALVGTEGTCVTVLRAKLQLIGARPERTLVVVGFTDAATAGDHVPMVREHRPVACEGIDRQLVDFMTAKGLHPEDVDLLPDGDGFLLVEFGSDDKADADEQAARFVDACENLDTSPSTKTFTDAWEAQKLWQVRESGLGATAHVPGMGETHPGWEDAAVPPEKVGDYLRDFRDLLDEFDYHASLYGHFGQGCIHCRIDFRLHTAHGVTQWRQFLGRAAELVTSYGGSLSGEHGDGQARAALLETMYGSELVEAFAEFKAVWDPEDLMNPGKVVRPHAPTDDLRRGPAVRLTPVRTHFAFPDDDHDFGKAAARCVGVGQCRNVDTGGMCPSYMATREEEDSTRGRARMLFEMLRDDNGLTGWRDDHVADALELCLACKACRHECPVNVDMATYKAEFLSHYYKGRLRPRSDYAITLIYWWARIASRAPRLVNAVTQNRVLARVLQKAGGVATQRAIPRFRSTPFSRSFRARPREDAPRPVHDGSAAITHGDAMRYRAESYSTLSMQHGGRRNTLHPHGTDAPIETDRVILWPDTFNNYLESEVLEATVEVLEHAGYQVTLPSRPLCCGRPLYDAGMLTTAEHLWRQVLDTLRDDIRAGVPVVGVEPSCVAAFRDELVGLLPGDDDARRLSEQTFILSEFLERQRYQPPPLPQEALVQMHCHHVAVLGTDAEEALLRRMGVDADVMDAGCCGLAGSFGFSADKYEVSVRVGERKMAPLVRAAEPATQVVTDGFSCREQIEHLTERRPRHLAELLRDAVRAERTREEG